MTPAFRGWFAEYRILQSERELGRGGDLWARIRALEGRVDAIAVEGLDAAGVARALLAIERASVFAEERQYERAMCEIGMAHPTVPVPSELSRIIDGSRALIEGNILHVQGRHDEAVVQYEAALRVAGEPAAQLRANAAFNLGVIRYLQGKLEVARAGFERAAAEYERANLPGKLPDCWHQLGLLLRERDETLSQALRMLMRALDQYVREDNVPGQWRVADDLGRLWAVWADAVDEPAEKARCYEQAFLASTGAAMAAARLWRDPAANEGRLADLSEQLLNHTLSHCEFAAVNDNMPHLLGALAVNKGRIRAVREPVPAEALVGLPREQVDALEADDPRAFLGLIHAAMPRLNRRGDTLAIVDQLGLRGDRLLSGVTVIGGDDPRWDVLVSQLYPPDPTRARRSLRGQDRCRDVDVVVQRLQATIRAHATRCAWVLGDDHEPSDAEGRRLLAAFAAEMDDDLTTLGRWFFPAGLLEMLREMRVAHVVLVPDPAFTTVPYLALRTEAGCVIDQPWSLSLLTSSMELLRLAYRRTYDGPSRPLVWMAPDPEVNSRRGGDEERIALEALLPLEVHRGQEATRAQACAALAAGRWLHLRGHGAWLDDVATSGPVFANGEILDRATLESAGGEGGFLVTAACFTGFASAIGSEAFGSLVDYDRARLRGAVLTRWPIHGPATVAFMGRFYRSLLASSHAGRALQEAARQTRDAAPHPYLWAPFMALGAWEVLPR